MKAVLNRLVTERGHVDGTVELAEDDTHGVHVIERIAGVRGANDRVRRIECEHTRPRRRGDRNREGESIAAVAEVVEILGLRRGIA